MMGRAGLRRGRFPPRRTPPDERGNARVPIRGGPRMLSAIGLDERQEAAYRALVAAGAAVIAAISAVTLPLLWRLMRPEALRAE